MNVTRLDKEFPNSAASSCSLCKTFFPFGVPCGVQRGILVCATLYSIYHLYGCIAWQSLHGSEIQVPLHPVMSADGSTVAQAAFHFKKQFAGRSFDWVEIW